MDSWDDVKARVTQARFRPLFKPDEYLNNTNRLKWFCENHQGEVEATWSYLGSKGCGECRRRASSGKRLAKGYAEVADILEERGDRIITKADEFTDGWMTWVTYQCGLCGSSEATQQARKIFEGRRHSCARNLGRAEKAVEDAKVAVAERLAAMGFVLVSFHEWKGRDTLVDVIDPDGCPATLTKSLIDQRFQRFQKR